MFDLEFLAVGLFVVTVLMVVVRIFAGWRIWKLWKANASRPGEQFKFEDQDSVKARAESS